MEVIFLHGPPAVGKLTVARALKGMIPARLSDNHAAIDLAKTVINFGAPGFWDLIHVLRLDLLEAAATADLPYFLTTACYHVGDESVLADWQAVMDRHAATFLPVHLTCTADVQAERVVQPDRTAKGKLDDVSGLERYMAKNAYVPLPHENCLQIDTTHKAPQDVAQHIIDHFGLIRRPI